MDFATLSRVAKAEGSAVHGPIRQGIVLKRLGIELRAAALAKSADDPGAIGSAFHRLTDPSEMGDLFKGIAVTRPERPAPPGFAP
ncbi:MAG: hypothetical protein AAFW64_07405 [Pseudomonadota bacterium]